MSDRCYFAPSLPSKPEYADWIVAEGATDDDLRRLADDIFWRFSVKLFVPRLDDPRLLALERYLNEDERCGIGNWSARVWP